MAPTKLTREEVARHNTSDDAWVVIEDTVYNVTNFLNDHPGGPAILLEHAGGDGTDAFRDVGHSDNARGIMADYRLGRVGETYDARRGGCNYVCGVRPWIIAGAATALAGAVAFYAYSAHHARGH